MIDPGDPLETQVQKQAKIIDALIARANHQHELGGSAYALFQSAIALQSKVSQKTRDLEDALHTLGHASNRLEFSEEARAQTQRTLEDALETMDGGFALFTEGKLQVFNDFFKCLIPDIDGIVSPGLDFTEYVNAVANSTSIQPRDVRDRLNLGRSILRRQEDPSAPFVFALKSDRWFVITHRRASSNNTVILQTEITAIVRNNRLEKNRLIDEQETFLHAAFDHMPQGVGTFSAEGTLLISNARFGGLLRLPIQLTSVGTSFGQIIEFLKTRSLVEDLPHENFDSFIRFLRRTDNLRLHLRLADGAVLAVDMHPLPDGGCIVNVMDVTVQSQTTEMLETLVQERTSELTEVNEQLRRQHREQARVEEDLRVAKAEVEAAMSSKTRFFAAASHDLLQPINAAMLMISTLSEQSAGTAMSETVQRLNGSFRSMEGLLHALLDISRLEATETNLVVTSFPLQEVLHTVAEDLGELAVEKGLDLRVVPSSLWVRSDQRYLARSIQNLVDNAIQYTNVGRILVGCRRQGGRVSVEVWDTGVGISEEDQRRIFAEFTRVGQSQSAGHGVGLGLSIVEHACRHLKHRVSVRSTRGVGSVFSIELPVAPAEQEVAASKLRHSARPQSDMDLIVLQVENDPSVAFAMTQKLESWGASVLAAESTVEALDLVHGLGMPPDIILADYQLNDGDTGIRTIEALRRSCERHIPAIMITANHEDSIKEAGLSNGFSVLTKPVQLSRLRSLMDWKTRQGAQSRPK